MTSENRFVLLSIAAAIAVVAFIVLRPDDKPGHPAGKPVASATSESGSSPPAEAGTATPRRRPEPPLLTGSKVRELEVNQGETVRFAVRSPSDDEVHVHGYDRSIEAPAGTTVQVSFKATITGIFEIELEQAGKPIAELKVEP